jgi:hypothetical protein
MPKYDDEECGRRRHRKESGDTESDDEGEGDTATEGEDEDDDGNNADNIDDWGFGSVESREER